MKIAFVAHRFPFLANTFILREIVELQRAGHQIKIISVRPPLDEVVHADVAKHRLLDVTRYLTNYVPLERQWLRRWKRKLRKFLGMKRRRAFAPRPNPPWLPAVPRMAAELEREGFDIIHAAFGNVPADVALKLSEVTGLPMTFELHAFDLYVAFADAQRKLAAASRVFTISEYNRSHLERELGCSPEKIVVKRVSFDMGYCDSLLPTKEQEGLVVTACRLHPIKGLDVALRAIALLADRHPTLRYVILGDGPLRGDLERLVDELGLEGRVQLRGAIEPTTVLDQLAQCSVSLLPSRIVDNGDRDGIPTALVEAMCLHKPVVSTRVSGIPELVDHGVNGLLADHATAEAIATNLERLLTDPDLRRIMGAQARRKIETMFDLDANMRLLVDGLEDAIASSRIDARAS